DFASDGSVLASVTGGNQISIRDPRIGAERQKLSSSGYLIERISLSRDGKSLASVSTNGPLEFWNTKDGKLLAKTNLSDGAHLMAWLSAKEIAITGNDTNIQL